MDTANAGGLVFNPATTEAVLKQYLDDAAGPYSSAGGYLSFEKIPQNLRANFSASTTEDLATLAADWPEIEYLGSGFPGGFVPTIGVLSGILLAPFSRGSVTISTASMSDNPVIDLGWLTNPTDAELAVAAFKRVRQAWASPPANQIKIGGEIVPGSTVSSDADILAYIRQTLATMWHASSTCAMGRRNDPMAVVDSNAKVFGVSGLRVVDASVLPFALPNHPQATIYALAEKIADAILRGR
jgi:choline dehydrogenase